MISLSGFCSNGDFYNDLSKLYNENLDKLSSRKISNTLKKVNQDKLFEPYKNWLLTLSRFATSKKFSHLKDICLNYSNENSLTFLNTDIEKKCALYFKKNLFRLKKDDYKKATVLFFKYISIFSHKASDKEKGFLEKVSSLKEGQDLYNILLEKYLASKNLPSKNFSLFFMKDQRFKDLYKLYGANSLSKKNRKLKDLKRLIKPLYNLGGKKEFSSQYKAHFNKIFKNIQRNSDFLDNPKSIKEMFYFTSFLGRNKKTKEIRTLLDYLYIKYTSITLLKNDYYFYYLWSFYLDGNTKDANAFIKQSKLLANYKTFPSKLQYWISQSLKGQLEEIKIQKLLLGIVKTNPISYYASVATKELKKSNKYLHKQAIDFYLKPPTISFTDSEYINFSKTFSKSLERAQIFSNKNIYNLFFKEISELKKEEIVNKYKAHTKLASVKMQEYGLFLPTFRLFYQELESGNLEYDKEILLTLFPSPYKTDIQKLTMAIDHKLVLSLIRQESSFNPSALSPVGAMGLMQLMPYTAKRFDKKVKKKDLLQYSKNIKLGISYLLELNERYNKNIMEMLSAYNAGERRIDKWKNTYLIDKNPLINIEHIPFNETRKYVKLIKRNMFFYDIIEKEKQRSVATTKDQGPNNP